jgi:hypothetical protein
MTAGPHFLGIGAQKAGTTWLWSQLARHPGVWMPPVKELHYFDRSRAYPSPSYLAEPKPLRRLASRSHREWTVRGLRAALPPALGAGDWSRVVWTLRYYFGTYDDDWYRSLFPVRGDVISGEITPGYAILSAEDVGRIHSMFPAAKIIFLVRNPIDRAWSQARFRWTMGSFDAIADAERVRQFLDAPIQDLRGDYLRTLDTWEAAFSKAQVFVGFYDDIRLNPMGLLSEVFDFLGIDALPARHAGLVERVNVSRRLEMPEEIRRFLAHKYYEDIQRLSRRFGGHADRWLADTDEILRAKEMQRR